MQSSRVWRVKTCTVRAVKAALEGTDIVDLGARGTPRPQPQCHTSTSSQCNRTCLQAEGPTNLPGHIHLPHCLRLATPCRLTANIRLRFCHPANLRPT